MTENSILHSPGALPAKQLDVQLRIEDGKIHRSYLAHGAAWEVAEQALAELSVDRARLGAGVRLGEDAALELGAEGTALRLGPDLRRGYHRALFVGHHQEHPIRRPVQ